ncbi:hypothetical protein BX600DRAFT_518021 [Xylariales sp. PMI_506]|nr:hypothetical protein BX600DRAFT_518021 [Xylariales sp. PMI_506]
MTIGCIVADGGQRPPAACSAVDSAERARKREIASYLTAASFPPDLTSGPRLEAVISADATLNALVQLGPLRLDCDRSFLSLIDKEHQFIVAEMTRTHSLTQPKSSPNDAVYLGVCKLDICWGVCPTTMKAFMDETGEWIRTGPSVIANRTRYIINDFRTDPLFMDRPFTTGFPHMVSYLEVPLISPLGYVLGSYCVVDNRLREFNDNDTVGIMADIASAIMDHLELVKEKQNRHRAATLIDGLDKFIRHEPSSPNPTQVTHQYRSSISATSTDSSIASRPFGSPHSVVPHVTITDIHHHLNEPDPSANPTLPRSPSVSASLPMSTTTDSSILTSSSTEQETSDTPATTSFSATDQDPFEEFGAGSDLEANGVPSPDQLVPRVGMPTRYADGVSVSSTVRSTFFRATDTIRHAMNLGGLMFLDAIPLPSDDGGSSPFGHNLGNQNLPGPYSAIISQSIIKQASPTARSSSEPQLPANLLQNLLQRFPRGHVFSADEFGPIDASYDPGKPFKGGSQTAPDHVSYDDTAALFHVLPSARYVIFMPLWHHQRECWYGAALGWVNDHTQALGPTDVSLLSAFTSSIMNEVSKSEAIAMSSAKYNFISSISHELRSPIHGILASSELLREGNLDASALLTLDMIDSCGTTLLDTFNNLIDYANISNQGLQSMMPQRDLPLTDLGELVQDVIEAVTVSYMSENAFRSSIFAKGKDFSDTKYAMESTPNYPVLVSMMLETGPDWNISVDVGAWKRIVVEIFGNALKYTTSGLIDVELGLKRRNDKSGEPSNHLCFTVRDTGKGIGSDYAKYQLFTPFSKEDNLSPGVGLGLSIVKQLVTDLRGTLSIKSTVGQGTFVEVLIPVETTGHLVSDMGLQPPAPVLPISKNVELAGRTLCVIAPELYMKLAGSRLKLSERMQDRSALVTKALHTIAGDALGLAVLVATQDSPTPKADIYFLDISILQDMDPSESSMDMLGKVSELSPLVLFCPGPRTCSGQDSLRNHKLHLHQPLVPRKLASVLVSAIKSSTSRDDLALPLSPPASRDIAEALDSQRSLEPSSISFSPAKMHEEQEQPHLEHAVSDQQLSYPEVGGPDEQFDSTTRHHLLVDDNPINVKLLTAIVRKLNHTYSAAYNGLEAVQQYHMSIEQRRPFHTIFMDVSMPVMNGFEATRQIRQIEKSAGLPPCRIVMLTGLGSEANRDEAFASGTDVFLTKPVKLKTVRELLGV